MPPSYYVERITQHVIGSGLQIEDLTLLEASSIEEQIEQSERVDHLVLERANPKAGSRRRGYGACVAVS
jgi:hypothetical protein